MNMVDIQFENRALLIVYLVKIELLVTQGKQTRNYSHRIQNSTSSVEISALPNSLLNEHLTTDQNNEIKQELFISSSQLQSNHYNYILLLRKGKKFHSWNPQVEKTTWNLWSFTCLFDDDPRKELPCPSDNLIIFLLNQINGFPLDKHGRKFTILKLLQNHFKRRKKLSKLAFTFLVQNSKFETQRHRHVAEGTAFKFDMVYNTSILQGWRQNQKVQTICLRCEQRTIAFR